jgi:hypothetical protein
MNVHYMYEPESDSENTKICGKFFHIHNFQNRIHICPWNGDL